MNATPGEARSDEQLLEAVATDDRDALAELFRRHAPWLTLRLSRRYADPSVVEEVVQDTFVSVWRAARQYRGEGNVAAWIWGIGIRRLISRLRKRRPLPFPSLHDWATESSAEEQVLLGVEHGDLAGALNRLSPEFRAVIQARLVDGLSTRETARLLGVPAGTVKTRLLRAKAQLRGELT